MRYLTHQEARNFYNQFGSKQDTQHFYEDKAIDTLIEHADFEHAQAIFEFGCGTGRLAKRLLTDNLPENTAYVGFDISSTMVDLASHRIKVFYPRAQAKLSQGETRLPFPENTFDRFVSTYVLDLLPEHEIRELISEAHRVLRNSGLVVLASLSYGESILSRIVTALWNTVYRVDPKWVGGCRPLSLKGYAYSDGWNIIHQEKIVQFGITSDVLIAQKVPV